MLAADKHFPTLLYPLLPPCADTRALLWEQPSPPSPTRCGGPRQSRLWALTGCTTGPETPPTRTSWKRHWTSLAQMCGTSHMVNGSGRWALLVVGPFSLTHSCQPTPRPLPGRLPIIRAEQCCGLQPLDIDEQADAVAGSRLVELISIVSCITAAMPRFWMLCCIFEFGTRVGWCCQTPCQTSA